jgi:Holliday junction resolvasome RuvABC ATP-dependent DNA helicase subunit
MSSETLSVQQQMAFPRMDQDEINEILDLDNLWNPYHQYVGNRPAVEMALDVANKSYNSLVWASDKQIRCNRQVSARLLLVGPKSCGKTKYARCLATMIGTPYIEVDATKIKKVEQLFQEMSRILKQNNVPLIPNRIVGSMRYYDVPPSVLFIDEIHAFKRAEQDALLKMTEADDGKLITQTANLDCKEMLIMGATTDLGKICSAFKSRFTVVKFVRHTSAEVAQVVQNMYPVWKAEDCKQVAKLAPTTRQALEFSKNVLSARERLGGLVSEAIAEVAKRMGLDSSGLSNTAIEALKALADAAPTGLSRKALCGSLSIEESEFANDILPMLLTTSTHSAYVNINTKHRITEHGLEVLRSKGYDV